MICQNCGIEAPTRYVAFHQNIGLLVMRLYNGTEGQLCKPCIHKTYWTYTAINLTLGWWGILSLIVTPFFLINNAVRYALCLGMESPRPGAAPPVVTEEVFQAFEPHLEQVVSRLNAGEDFERVCEDSAMRSGLTPAQVAVCLRMLVAAQQRAT